jgi:hypothetical protein
MPDSSLSSTEMACFVTFVILDVICFVAILMLCIKRRLPCTDSRRDPPSPVDLEAQKKVMEERKEIVKEASQATNAAVPAKPTNASTAPSSRAQESTWSPTSSQAQMAASAAAVTSPKIKAYQLRVEDVPEASEVAIDPMSYSFGSGKDMAAMYK